MGTTTTFKAYRCPECDAPLTVDEAAAHVKRTYCGHTFALRRARTQPAPPPAPPLRVERGRARDRPASAAGARPPRRPGRPGRRVAAGRRGRRARGALSGRPAGLGAAPAAPRSGVARRGGGLVGAAVVPPARQS